MQASNGGILLLDGTTGEFTNTGGLIQALAGSEVQLFDTAAVTGGTFSTTGSGVIRVNASENAFFTNIVNNGTMVGDNASDLGISGTITNNGTMTMNAAGSNTDIEVQTGGATLTGGGTVTLNGANAGINGLSGGYRLINVNNTIQGEGAIGENLLAVTNQAGGLIDANVSGQTLTIDPVANADDLGPSFLNQGTMQASNGGILVFSGASNGDFTNTGGLIQALAGSEVQFANNASLTGGTLDTAGSGLIRINSSQNVFFTDLTNNGTVVGDNNTDLGISGTITNSGTITMNPVSASTDIEVQTGGATLTGGGTVTLNGALAGINGVSGGYRLTNVNNIIQGEGAIGENFLAVTNQAGGLIDANVNGQTLTIDPVATADDLGPSFLNQGTLRASNGGTVSLTGVGVGDFTNTGTFEALDGSTIAMISSASLTNLSGGTLTGGTYRSVETGSGSTVALLGTAVDTLAATTTVEVSGANSIFTVGGTALQDSLVNNAGTLRVLDGRTLAMTNALNNTGTTELGGSGLAAATLTSGGDIANSASGEIFGHGTINNTILNSGLVRAASGTMAIVGGVIDGQSGTIQVDPGATLDLSGASGDSDADYLVHNGNTAGSLNLGANNVIVDEDYTNANFGTGNSFDARANVSGSGEIQASGNVDQAITGDGSGGTIAFGNVHVGDSNTLNYQIANAGTTGPDLRGAIQTTANGGNITDARLSGAGVTASNFGPIATGTNTGNLAVTFNATTAGALSGQTVHIENNFDNVAGDNIAITGAAYRLANPTDHTPEPVSFGNFHVGDSAPTQALSLTNNNPADGFSEVLDASIGSATGGVTTNGGSFNDLAAGATDNTSLSVGIDTSSAGSKNGTATISLTSDGTGTSGLGTTALASQTVNVSGSVYRLAAPGSHTPEPVNFGVVHVGETPSQTLTIGNTAANDGFSENLDASFSGTTGAASATGSFSGLAAGSSDNSSLSVGIDTATIGNKSGAATLSLTSNGAGTSGLGTTALASQTVNVQAQVNYFAEAEFTLTSGIATLTMNSATEFTLAFGQVVQNSGTVTADLAVLNTLQDLTFQDDLGGSFILTSVTDFDHSGFTTFSSIGPGSSFTDPEIGFDSSMAIGNYSNSLVYNPTSTNASDSTNLSAITLNITGEVIPEPSTFVLLTLGLLAVASRFRRRS